MPPKFSIIIPVYNVAPYLRECLDSVLAQTYTDWEAICVDDGSTDGSGAILDEYAEKDKRFSVYHKKNGGVGSARNLGLDEARGEWIWCVDGDDEIHPNSLFSLVRCIESSRERPQCIFIGLTQVRLPEKDKLLSGEAFELSQHNSHQIWRTPAYTILRKDLIGVQRFTKFKIAEDVIFILEYLNRNLEIGSIIKISEPLYFYKVRMGSAFQNFVTRNEVNEEHFKAEEEILRLLKMILEPRGLNAGWHTSNLFCSHKSKFFRMPFREMKKLQKYYFSNIEFVHNWIPYDRGTWFRFLVYRVTESPFVGKCIIYLPCKIKAILIEFARKLRNII